MSMQGNRAIWEAETEGLELLDLTIGEMLDRQALASPEREALVYHYPERGLSLCLTHRQYREEANRLAKGLLALGIEKGDHTRARRRSAPIARERSASTRSLATSALVRSIPSRRAARSRNLSCGRR